MLRPGRSLLDLQRRKLHSLAEWQPSGKGLVAASNYLHIELDVEHPEYATRAGFDISANEHASAHHQIGKEGTLIDGRHFRLGMLDPDVK